MATLRTHLSILAFLLFLIAHGAGVDSDSDDAASQFADDDLCDGGDYWTGMDDDFAVPVRTRQGDAGPSSAGAVEGSLGVGRLAVLGCRNRRPWAERSLVAPAD